jgi:L-asparaginase type I
MDYTADGLSVVAGLFEAQLKSLSPIADVELDLIEYEDLIDSSDITLNHWLRIIDDICINYDNYDGFIVVHGTDTMAYTASMLAFALRGICKPIVITGAQLPLVHRRSDGWNNLIDAIYSAMQPQLHEVAIVFNHNLFRGCRAQKVSTNRFIGFDSVDEEPLAEFGINIVWHKRRWLQNGRCKFKPIILKPVTVLNLVLNPGYTTEFIADTLMNNHKLQAVVLQTYGSGTIPMRDTHLLEAIEAAVARGVIIVSVTQVIEGRISNEYSNSKLSKYGVVSGCDMTPEAALAKLWVLLSAGFSPDRIKDMIGTSLVGELTQYVE